MCGEAGAAVEPAPGRAGSPGARQEPGPKSPVPTRPRAGRQPTRPQWRGRCFGGADTARLKFRGKAAGTCAERPAPPPNPPPAGRARGEPGTLRRGPRSESVRCHGFRSPRLCMGERECSAELAPLAGDPPRKRSSATGSKRRSYTRGEVMSRATRATSRSRSRENLPKTEKGAPFAVCSASAVVLPSGRSSRNPCQRQPSGSPAETRQRVRQASPREQRRSREAETGRPRVTTLRICQLSCGGRPRRRVPGPRTVSGRQAAEGRRHSPESVRPPGQRRRFSLSFFQTATNTRL